jgi:5-methylcytosine-specific restriction endonuclease McrA
VAGTLVLNASYEPLCIVPLRRAVVLVLAEKAVVVEEGETLLRSERLAMNAPTVVRLSRYVRVPYRRAVPLTRRAVLARDGHRCAYCSARADTIDHVLPRSRGGGHIWTNVVAACARCNHRKGDRLLSEMGWRQVPTADRAAGHRGRRFRLGRPRPGLGPLPQLGRGRSRRRHRRGGHGLVGH